LAIGIVGGALTYMVGTRLHAPTTADLLPASAREHRRQMGILYGGVGTLAVELSDAIARPDVQAGLVLAGGIITCAICVRLADSEDDVT
jgi:hypothetical protein